MFSRAMIDSIITHLRSYNDRTLRKDIGHDLKKVLNLVQTYFHCG